MTDRIERELELPAPSDEVWEALTDPERLAGWLADEVSFDLRPGGEASFRDGETLRRGWVEEVSAPASRDGGGRLAFWWASDDEPASRVELTLEPAPASFGAAMPSLDSRARGRDPAARAPRRDRRPPVRLRQHLHRSPSSLARPRRHPLSGHHRSCGRRVRSPVRPNPPPTAGRDRRPARGYGDRAGLRASDLQAGGDQAPLRPRPSRPPRPPANRPRGPLPRNPSPPLRRRELDGRGGRPVGRAAEGAGPRIGR